MPSTSSTGNNTPTAIDRDWLDVKVQHVTVVSLERSSQVDSLEWLRGSIGNNLQSISNTWVEIEKLLSVDVPTAPLSERFAKVVAFRKLDETVKEHHGDGLVSVKSLMGDIEKAIGRIYRSREAPWGSWRSIGSQKSIVASDGLTTNAMAAFMVLYHVDYAVRIILSSLEAVHEVETKSAEMQGARALHGECRMESQCQTCETLRGRDQELTTAIATTGQSLRNSRTHVGEALNRAKRAVPPERRRWKTRIAILVCLYVLSAAVIAMTILLPPMLPALIIVGVALKIASGILSGVSLLNSVFTMVAYPRNRGWTDMSNRIESVRNLYSAMDMRIGAQTEAACAREEMLLLRRFNACCDELHHMATDRSALAQGLQELDNAMTAANL
ncbi:hypothetical protein [Pandoraea aquatica]|uniref:hypothetical protein n=1 Tax=Pandoraea aquatica TaxID=2508290 RepID=UPI00123F6F34|nr:hypothetical protein [Pandoraea aquatica]